MRGASIVLRFLSVFAFFLLFAAAPARAQVTCAPGTHSVIASYEVPNASFCAPDETDDSEDAPGDAEPEPARPEPVWQTRWGAIAIGEGAYGSSTNYGDEAAARQRAITECQASSGGKPCRVQLAFFNQCAALASGDGGSISFGAATIERARELALAKCFEHTAHCEVTYSGCSLPELVG